MALQNSAREALQQQVSRIDELNQQLEDARQEVVKQKTANRTVREEMRRLQSSIQLMERQRNPGVGYWSAANGKSGKAVDSPGDSGRPSGESSRQERPPTVRSPTPSEVGSSRNEEEEVNLEYLRNVILQFLENKEMRVSRPRECARSPLLTANATAQPRQGSFRHLALHASGIAATERETQHVMVNRCSLLMDIGRCNARGDVLKGRVYPPATTHASCKLDTTYIFQFMRLDS